MNIPSESILGAHNHIIAYPQHAGGSELPFRLAKPGLQIQRRSVLQFTNVSHPNLLTDSYCTSFRNGKSRMMRLLCFALGLSLNQHDTFCLVKVIPFRIQLNRGSSVINASRMYYAPGICCTLSWLLGIPGINLTVFCSYWRDGITMIVVGKM